MTNPNTPERTRLLASGLLVVTFVVGALAGAAGDRLLTAEPEVTAPATADTSTVAQRERDRNRSPRGSILLDPKVLEELGTTEEQKLKINAVLARRDQEAKRIYKEMEPRLRDMMKQTRDELRALLTPEQLTKLDQLIEERRARWRQSRGNGNQSKSPTDSAKKPTEPARDHEPGFRI